MTQEMKVIILQENIAAGNHGHIMVSVKSQNRVTDHRYPVLMIMMNT